jgi:hypothetical protein
MSVSSAALAALRGEFTKMAGEAFDAMFDSDQQEQLITLTQREDRVLQKGAELQEWLLARHLARDPSGQPEPSEAVPCRTCGRPGVPDKTDTKPARRRVRTRAGPQELKRLKYRCPKCRRVFFPPGRETRPRP